jgi:hypothetical protein
LILLYNNLHALPIKDGVPGVYKALWKKSAGMPCHQVCRPYRDEFARIFHAPTKTRMTFDCKAFVKKIEYSNQEYCGWAFGNNFHGRYQNYCVVSTPNLKVEMKKKFMCLCAR